MNGACVMPVLSTISFGSLLSKVPGIIPDPLKLVTNKITDPNIIIPRMSAATSISS